MSPATLVERLRDYAGHGFASDHKTDCLEAAASIEALAAERDAARAKWNNSDGDMRGAALHAVRETLYAGEVPLAAFIDDHVANAIVQRNQERARAETAELRLADAVKALEEISKALGVPLPYTTGHCENHKQPGGCPLHNLQCGWPDCDIRSRTGGSDE